MKRTLFITITFIITVNIGYAKALDDILKDVCGSDEKCPVCINNDINQFFKCENKYVFNPLYEEQFDDSYSQGGLSKDKQSTFCSDPSKKIRCDDYSKEIQAVKGKKVYAISESVFNMAGLHHGDAIINDSILCNMNGCIGKTVFGGRHAETVDLENDVCCYSGSYSYPMGYCSSCSSGSATFPVATFNLKLPVNPDEFYIDVDINNSGNYVRHKVSHPTQYVEVSNVKGSQFYTECNGKIIKYTDSERYYYCNRQLSTWHYKHNINLRIPSYVDVKEYSYICPVASYPCTKDNLGQYYCTPVTCGIPTSDGNLTDEEKTPENMTPEYTDSTTGVCKPDENIYLFTPLGGRHKECRQAGHNFGANDLTSPDQCARNADLDDNTKNDLIGGVNKVFDKIKTSTDPLYSIFGDLSAFVNPVTALLVVYQGIGKLIIENLGEDPTAEEKELTLLRGSYGTDGSCHRIGEYCSSYNMDGMYGKQPDGTKFDWTSCGRKSSLFCCYDSPIAKAFNKAAREQLKGIGWGENLEVYNLQSNYKQPRPNCRGITIEELSKINMDDPEFGEEMKAYVNDVLLPELMGPGGMLDMTRLTETSKKMADDIQNYYK